MFCRFCGTELSDDSRFCFKCGKGVVDSGPEEERKVNLNATVQATPRQAKDYSTPQLRVEGENGQIEIYEDKIAIRRKGIAAKLLSGAKECEYQLSQLKEIQVVEPSRLAQGYIRFRPIGSDTGTVGFWRTNSDKDTVMFNNREKKQFNEFRDAIQKVLKDYPLLSVSDKTQSSSMHRYMKPLIGVIAVSSIIYACAGPTSNQPNRPQENKSIPKEIQATNQSPNHSFKPVYRVINDEDMSVGQYIRRSVKIVVPLGLSKDELTANLKHAAYSVYDKSNTNAIYVFAYREDDPNKSRAYTAGRCLLAPDGEWTKANQKVSRDALKTVIDLAEYYFVPPKKTIPVNTAVELYFTPVNNQPVNIIVSNNPMSSDPDEDLVVEVPSGTPATVIGVDKFFLPEGEMITYKVKLRYRGREYVGWVDDYKIKN